MRKPRMLRDGATYHVVARANRKEAVMQRGAMKALFISTLRRARRRYRFRIENFCVMGNHIHLMIRPASGTDLSRLMQWVLSVFAMAYNRRHSLTGHVWGERFKSRMVEGLKGFLEVFRYIDENPVKAALVGNPRDWRFGGLWWHRNGDHEISSPPHEFVALLFPQHAILSIQASPTERATAWIS